ncbi:MAG TPA: hypothetical protein VKD90_11130 [Gemmataceae bacterium]|nr:hypothetical protein [Gemmataceae bacterium]
MKKLLCLAVFAAFLGASVGCDDKKTSAPPKPATGATGGTAGTAKTTP